MREISGVSTERCDVNEAWFRGLISQVWPQRMSHSTTGEGPGGEMEPWGGSSILPAGHRAMSEGSLALKEGGCCGSAQGCTARLARGPGAASERGSPPAPLQPVPWPRCVCLSIVLSKAWGTCFHSAGFSLRPAGRHRGSAPRATKL